MFRSPSARSASGSPQQSNALKRTFKKSFSGSIKSTTSDHANEAETPIATLRVQVVSCRDLPAADMNGYSDPYVVLHFGDQRFKTPVIKKSLNPKWTAKDATFDFPVYASAVETRGALVELVVWDKDTIGKDYLAECSLAPATWFTRKGTSDRSPYGFDETGNNPVSHILTNQRPRKARPNASSNQPSIQIKIGLVPAGLGENDLKAAYEEIIEKSALVADKLYSAPPTQAISYIPTAPSRTSTMGSSTTGSSSSPKKTSFNINWEGTKINYDFATRRSVAGVVLLEVQGAKELPKAKNFLRTGFDMDPFVVIKYGDEVYRTKVIRHDLNPTFNDRFILFVRRPGSLSQSTTSAPGSESTTVFLSVLDWEQVSKNKHIGSTTLNLQTLFDAAPKPDTETGLYSVEAMRLHGFSEIRLEISLSQKEKWEGKGPVPTVLIKAKYDPNGAMRQRYWRMNLKEYDHDHSGQLSHKEILEALEETGLDVATEDVDRFFKELNKDPKSDELTIEEAMICLEKEYGQLAEIKAAEEEAAVADNLTQTPDASFDASQEDSEGDRSTDTIPEESELPAPTPRPPRSSMYGHSRESIADLETQLRTIFQQHPKAYYPNIEAESAGEAVVPASAVLDIIATFSDMYDIELMNADEQTALRQLVETMPNTEIGPDFLITFLATATGDVSMDGETNPNAAVDSDPTGVVTPQNGSPRSPNSTLNDQADDESEPRGRDASSHHSRSSSRDSVQTSYRVAPETPKSSVFDVRARSTPLEAAPPSSWASRPQPASRRRRSSVGSIGSKGQSEGEDQPVKSGFNRGRAPSNPPAQMEPYTFPPHNNSDSAVADDSPPPRPPSQNGFRSLRMGKTGSVSNPALPLGDRSTPSPDMDSSANPSLESSRYDTLSNDDDEDAYSHDRFSSDRTSMFSINTNDRVDELERINSEQAKKLKEVQKTLEEKMSAHETEIEELMVQKEEIESELAASRREEKELRLKDVNSSKQLTALESEVSRLQKEIETVRNSYQNMQRLYQEQCNEAEKYRDSLRRKDIELKDSEKVVGVLSADVEKLHAQHDAAQELLVSVNRELDAAREAMASLDRQKQENLSLKETIDRLRFEMDELRNSRTDAGNASAGPSRVGTAVPSLAAEMAMRLKEAEGDRPQSTGDGDEQDEDYVETVITRRKMAKKPKSPPESNVVRVQEMFRDYGDVSVQKDMREFTAEAATQTMDGDEPAASSSKSTAAPAAVPVEAPPSYTHLLEEQERQRKLDLAADFAKWHSGREHTDAIPEGVSSDTIEEWNRIKGEIGFSCGAIDEVLQKSHVTGPRPESAKPVPEVKVEDTPEVLTLPEETKPSGPAGVERVTKWTVGGLVGAFCLVSFVGGFGIASLFRSRAGPFDRRLWDVVNDVAKAGSFPDLLHRPPAMPWGVIKNVQEQLMRPNWEPV
ncbi:hypothetical protein DL93DRAFT_2223196 [Clavulina sp. PMI_390]|nr:hypothetical protein DL93DRAFT_2223196 [Clavulina sp. PMI_390]